MKKVARDRLRDYGRESLFGPDEPEIDPIATEREIEELQQERLKRLRRPTFDPEPVEPEPEPEPEEYEPRPYQGDYVDTPKYKVFKSKSGEVLGYAEDGIELDEDGNPKKTIRYDYNDWGRPPSQVDGDDEPDYKTQTDREKVDNWLKTGSFPSTEGFPGWDKVGGVAGEIAGEKIALAREKLGNAREYVGDVVEHYDDRRLLSYGVDPDLISTYRAWEQKYAELRENGNGEGAKAAYRELRAVRYQIDSQVDHYRQLEQERRTKSAELKRREQGIGRAGYTAGGRSTRSSGRSTRPGISDRGLENRMLPKRNPANVSLFPERRRGSNLTVDVRRNQNIDLSVRGNPGAISPVVRRSGAVAGGVPPLSGGVSPLVQKRTQYTPTLHRPRYEPARQVGQPFPTPRQARVPEPQRATTPRFQFPTVKASGFFGGVIGSGVVDNIERNFGLPNRRSTTTQTTFKRRHETSPVKSTSQIVNNINALTGASNEKRRGARVSIGAPNINIPTIDPSRFASVTPRKMKKKKGDGATSKKRGNIGDNIADLAGVTIRRVRR